MCTGRVRDTFYECQGASVGIVGSQSDSRSLLADGHAPFIEPLADENDISSVLQTQTFSHPAAPDVSANAADREWIGVVTARKGPQSGFVVRYDNVRMYREGTRVRLEGDAAEGAEATDDGRGSVLVKIAEAVDGKNLTVVVSPA
jgi:hypothetical protein